MTDTAFQARNDAPPTDDAVVSLPQPDEVASTIQTFRINPVTSAFFAECIQKYNDLGLALRRLGLKLWADQRLPDAFTALKASLALNDNNQELWRDLAGVCVGLGNQKKAEACVSQALVRQPGDTQSWIMLADLQSKRGDLEGAIKSYRLAILNDPLVANAHFGLGIVLFQRGEYTPAAACFKACVLLDPDNAVAQLCLGHATYLTGDFAASSLAFAVASRAGALDQAAKRKFLRAQAFQTMIAGDIHRALTDYEWMAGDDNEGADIICRDAFSLLSGFGQLEAAQAVGAIILQHYPDDPTQRYLQDAVSKKKLLAAPVDYLEDYFDRFAPNFDNQLVYNLKYYVPEQLANLIREIQPFSANILDLGCGTGLAAPHLGDMCRALTGVDISGGMLAQAEKRLLYKNLIKSDCRAFLDRTSETFDVVFAADLIIYFGRLDDLLGGAHRRLSSEGLLAFNYETSDQPGYNVLPSGRFAHHPDYITAQLSGRFAIERREDSIIRMEAGQPVKGQLIVARRLSL